VLQIKLMLGRSEASGPHCGSVVEDTPTYFPGTIRPAPCCAGMRRDPPEWIGKLGVRLGTELLCPFIGPLPNPISDRLHAIEEAERRRGELTTDPAPEPQERLPGIPPGRDAGR
jgi:hypothetical protein